MAVPRPDAKHT